MSHGKCEPTNTNAADYKLYARFDAGETLESVLVGRGEGKGCHRVEQADQMFHLVPGGQPRDINLHVVLSFIEKSNPLSQRFRLIHNTSPIGRGGTAHAVTERVRVTVLRRAGRCG